MESFKEDEKAKRRACLVVVKFELIFGHLCFYVICVMTEFFGEVGDFTERSGSVYHPQKADDLLSG